MYVLMLALRSHEQQTRKKRGEEKKKNTQAQYIIDAVPCSPELTAAALAQGRVSCERSYER